MKRLFLLISLAGISFGLQADWFTWQGSMKEIEKIKENLLDAESDNIKPSNTSLLLLNQLMDSAYTIYDYSSPNIANFELILKSILNYTYEDLITISLENKKKALKSLSEVFSSPDRYDFRMLFVTQLRDALRQQGGVFEEVVAVPEGVSEVQIQKNLTVLQLIQASIASLKPTQLIKFSPDRLFRAQAAVKFALNDDEIRGLQDNFNSEDGLSALLESIKGISEPNSADRLQQATAYVLSQIQNKSLGDKWQSFLNSKLKRASAAAPAPKPVAAPAAPVAAPEPVVPLSPVEDIEPGWLVSPLLVPEERLTGGVIDYFAENDVVRIEKFLMLLPGITYSHILNNNLQRKKDYVNGVAVQDWF